MSAKLEYRSGDFKVISSGDGSVNCAVTGQKILLNELKYWSAERQEAYVDAAASLKAWQKEQE